MSKLFVVSDVHYAGAAERARGDYCYRSIRNSAQRLAVRVYRNLFWQRDPFAHNYLLDDFIEAAKGADVVVANGDYSCDSAFIGVADDAALASAAECLAKLRGQFADRFYATMGDHELGKKPLGADAGGLRLAAYQRACKQLGLKRFWQVNVGNYVLMGVTSTLLAFPVYESEALAEEAGEWRRLREEHYEEIARAFGNLQARERVLLFCHDPTALPYLGRIAEVRERMGQIERTIIGHLHSSLLLFKSRFLCGLPVISFLGHTPRRISRALREARAWRPFKVFLCPSPSGIQLLKDGGYCVGHLKPGDAGAVFRRERLRWKG